MRKALNIAHYLSLDVVAGAVAHYLMFSRLPTGNTPVVWLPCVILASTVWMIYVLDRLLDNLKDTQVPTLRHQFYARHHLLSWGIVGICGLFSAVSAFFLSWSVIVFGLIVAFLSGLYLFIVGWIGGNRLIHQYKEPFTAMIYTAGVWGSAASVDWASFHRPVEWILAVMLWLVTFQNLLLFSNFEQKAFPEAITMAKTWGTKNTDRIVQLITLLMILLVILASFWTKYPYQYLVLSIEVGVSIVQFWICTYGSSERYRWLGECAFILPGIALFWH